MGSQRVRCGWATYPTTSKLIFGVLSEVGNMGFLGDTLPVSTKRFSHESGEAHMWGGLRAWCSCADHAKYTVSEALTLAGVQPWCWDSGVAAGMAPEGDRSLLPMHLLRVFPLKPLSPALGERTNSLMHFLPRCFHSQLKFYSIPSKGAGSFGSPQQDGLAAINVSSGAWLAKGRPGYLSYPQGHL